MVNAHCPGALGNPKSEIRNPKEGRNPKTERTALQKEDQPVGSRLVRISGFGFLSALGFRASAFCLAALVAGAIVNPGGIRVSAAEDSISNWPQFRGPNCSGVALQARPPVHISPTNSVLWSIEAPWSPSSPCVWGDRIFLTAFLGDQLQTRGYDRRNGQLLWSAGVKATKLEAFNKAENSPASGTPATDGRHVVSYFASFGLICHNFEGKELWRHPLPVPECGSGFGSGTSPIIVGGLVVLNRDQEEHSSVLALDAETGKSVWESPRPDAKGSWGTPVVWRNDGRDQIVTPGSIRLKGYDLKTGQEQWMVQGVTFNAVTTPVVGDGMLFFAGWGPGKADAPWPSWESFLESHGKNKDGEIAINEFPEAERDLVRRLDVDHDGKITKSDWGGLLAYVAKGENVMVAVKPGGHGDISATHVAWKFSRGLPYVASPLFYEGRIYLIKDGGLLSSFDARTGQPYYLQEGLDAGGNYYSSPVAAGGRIYLASLAGKLTVVKAGGNKPEILHRSDFGDRILATPAIVGDSLYLRTKTKLYAFGG
jgi:outer membrane protein assembly factor BamB